MPQSNQIRPTNQKIKPGDRKAFFVVENHKGWPTDDQVIVVDKHPELEVEKLSPGRFRLTWGDRDIPEELWVKVQVASYGRERGTVRLTPVGANGEPLAPEVQPDGDGAA